MIIPETPARKDWPRLVAQKTKEIDKRLALLEALSFEAVIFSPTTEPASPVAGMTYFDSGTSKLRCYDGTSWNDCW